MENFVSLDTTAKTLTVKSRVAYQEAISELKNFKAGDRVWIVWSGIHDSSDAVRQVRQSETGRRTDENLVLPAELVSTETPNQVLTFLFLPTGLRHPQRRTTRVICMIRILDASRRAVHRVVAEDCEFL